MRTYARLRTNTHLREPKIVWQDWEKLSWPGRTDFPRNQRVKAQRSKLDLAILQSEAEIAEVTKSLAQLLAESNTDADADIDADADNDEKIEAKIAIRSKLKRKLQKLENTRKRSQDAVDDEEEIRGDKKRKTSSKGKGKSAQKSAAEKKAVHNKIASGGGKSKKKKTDAKQPLNELQTTGARGQSFANSKKVLKRKKKQQNKGKGKGKGEGKNQRQWTASSVDCHAVFVIAKICQFLAHY